MPHSPRHFSDQLRERFARRPIHMLIVLDGFGLGTIPEWDAIRAAHTPTLDRLLNTQAHTRVATHGIHVGLPAAKDLGGSEVGHLTMGAGEILDQGPTRINQAIADGSLFASDALARVLAPCIAGGTLHLLGLLSDGNIHSHINHIIALAEHAHRSGVRRLRLHVWLDGRDVGIQTALRYVDRMEAVFAAINCHTSHTENGQPDRDYCIASGGGRETISMDRDHHWERIAEGWQAHVHGVSANRVHGAREAIETARAATKGIIDQDLPAFVVVGHDGRPVGAMQDGDGVIHCNFRSDRAIQLSQAFVEAGFDAFDRGPVPDVTYAGMMVYDEDTNLPPNQLMGATKVAQPFGRRILDLGLSQFRLAETQKYPHVTFFFNGGYRKPLDPAREDYVLIPSDRGISFDQAPQMKAPELAEQACALIHGGNHRFGLVNFANTDMVGHTGNFRAAVAATEAVDHALGRICAALATVGGTALITADHGNADEMMVKNDVGDIEPCTKHSINPVPAILYDPYFDGGYALRRPTDGDSAASLPGLSHVAATNFVLLGQPVPDDLAPSLLVPPQEVQPA